MVQDTSWPTVTVMICTYDRPDEFRKTFLALQRFLYYPNLNWHVADDGTDESVLMGMYDFCKGILAGTGSLVTYSRTERKGWGANVNYAQDIIHKMRPDNCSLTYFTEDDYILKRKLDLRPYVAMLENYPQIGMVRFGVSGHDGIRARLRELDIATALPEYSEEVGQGSTGPGKVNVWDIELGHQTDWGAYGFYRYSNRPHLKHRRFHQAYGPYAEGKSLAETEQAMNHTIEAVSRNSGGNCPAIVVPCNWTYWYYDHIGHSRQGTQEDVHA